MTIFQINRMIFLLHRLPLDRKDDEVKVMVCIVYVCSFASDPTSLKWAFLFRLTTLRCKSAIRILHFGCSAIGTLITRSCFRYEFTNLPGSNLNLLIVSHSSRSSEPSQPTLWFSFNSPVPVETGEFIFSWQSRSHLCCLQFTLVLSASFGVVNFEEKKKIDSIRRHHLLQN